MKRLGILHIILLGLIFSCQPDKKVEDNALLFSKDNLVAWCIVPFDTLQRTPENRALMLSELGIKQFAYDWRVKHIPSFPLEVRAMKYLNIKLAAVWIWIDPDSAEVIIDHSNKQILDVIRRYKVNTDLWVGFGDRYLEGLTDEQKLDKATKAVQVIADSAKALGCGISLYNHGDWFGEPANEIRIIEKTGRKDIGIVYNFHHGHQQVAEFPALLKQMLPYLKTVNLNGMKAGGPQILPIGQGDLELEMLKTLKASGYNGSIGILGHVSNEDIKIVLQRNIEGLKSLLKAMGDEKALATY